MSEHNELPEFDFGDLEPQQKPVTNLFNNNYILREASAEAARKYRNAAVRAAKMQDGKVVGVDGIGDVETILVAACLFEEKSNKEIQVAVVRAWPNRVIKKLFDWVKSVSLLDEEVDTPEALKKRLSEVAKSMAKGNQQEREVYAVILESSARTLREPTADPNDPRA